jgi:hypothetical protein
MRCPHCRETIEEGLAFCPLCAAPLSAYSDPLIEGRSAESIRKAQKLSVRPTGALLVPILIIFWVICCPVATMMGMFLSRTHTNADGTNYLSASFSAVGVFLIALVLVPLSLALFWLAWGAWSQKPWAWYMSIAFLGILLLLLFMGYWPHALFWRWLWAAAVLVTGYHWVNNSTRAWFAIK